MKKILFILALFLPFLLISCGSDEETEDNTGDIAVENSPVKDKSIQEYNLEQMKSQSGTRTPGDTISLMEYVLNNYSEGSYLVYFDKTNTTNVPKPAVLYYSTGAAKYVFGVIAKSNPGERFIDPKNIIGYDQSYIDLDSTERGTAFFYLTLFEYIGDNNFNVVWETIVPSHGGFNNLTLDKWAYRGTPFVKINFHYAQGVGHIDYNYFLVNGLTSKPHLLMTYKGINFQRTIANVNNDIYPDYFEFLFIDLGDKVEVRDSIPFYWKQQDSVYVNTRNSRQTRPY